MDSVTDGFPIFGIAEDATALPTDGEPEDFDGVVTEKRDDGIGAELADDEDVNCAAGRRVVKETVSQNARIDLSYIFAICIRLARLESLKASTAD